MRLFHKHKWVEQERVFFPQTGRAISGLQPWQTDRFLYGFTEILWRCSECNKITTDELLGDRR